MDCSLPGFSVHGGFQARVLEWGAIAFSVYPIYIHTYTYIYIATQTVGYPKREREKKKKERARENFPMKNSNLRHCWAAHRK